MSDEAQVRDLQRQALETTVGEIRRRLSEKFRRYYPDCTDLCKPKSPKKEDHVALCRVLYQRHLDFFRATVKHREVCLLGANRIGKTDCAAYLVTAHLSGKYPPWWCGRRFDAPTQWWIAGDTMLTTRNILQTAMLGPPETVETQQWSGMLPSAAVQGITRKSGGVTQCVDTIFVRHVSGGTSTAQFLSYDQGRRAFQGTSRNIWLDEEPPETEDIYGEALTRTLDCDGLLLMTFTPLRGLTAFLSQYMETAVYLDRDGTETPASGVFGVGGRET